MEKQKQQILKISLLIIFALLLLSSCATIQSNPNSNLITTYEDDNLLANITLQNNGIELNIKNKTDSVITLLVEGSTTSMKNGETSKLIPEGTRYIQSNAIQSPLSIAPNGKFKKTFFPASAINWNDSKWGIHNWVDDDNISLVFPYTIDEKQNFIVVQKSFIENTNIIGTVKASKNYWHILFGGNNKYKEELYDIAIKDAINQYGSDIKLVNASYNGKWSPLSLTLYFNILGYVDNITFKADVQKINLDEI